MGSVALQKYVEGRLGDGEINRSSYIDGLEHLLYLNELKPKFALSLVSALPKYYANSKLGFSRYSSMKEALNAATSKYGKSTKSTVISDPDITIISAKPEV